MLKLKLSPNKKNTGKKKNTPVVEAAKKKKTKSKKPAARTINQEKAIAHILDEITKGNSLRSILPQTKRNQSLPALKTFLDWVAKDEELSKQYARACDIRALQLFEEIIEIADGATGAKAKVEYDEDGKKTYETSEADTVQKSRLQIDARKWVLSKMNPKKYGDKVELTGDKENPLAFTVTGMEIK